MGASTDVSEGIVGDYSHRVTVPLPKSLPELRFAAKRLFGRNKQIKMYHKGTVPITNPVQMAAIKHGDVVVVTLPEDIVQAEAPVISTHNAHYVPHKLQARPPKVAAEVKETLPFDAFSCYAQDFVKHPFQANPAVKPPKPAWDVNRSSDETGKSTYATHYPWHDATPREAAQSVRHALHTSSAPFEGVSSYKIDYVKHAAQRPKSAAARPAQRSDFTGPFEGVTTYTTDYKQVSAPLSARPVAGCRELKTEIVPFEGISEYQREYLKKETERRTMVHLVPELKSRLRTHRPVSARSARSARG